MTLAIGASYLIARAVNREICSGAHAVGLCGCRLHEFRTPLTTLRQFTDMLREGGARDEQRRQICYVAQAQ
jgi:signal transduction histidine kinase